MKLLANVFTGLVALIHIGILVLEMFFWNHPIGIKVFNMTAEVAESSALLALNQGLYNGFLAVGLLWGLAANRSDVKTFFLGCVIVAGVFGSITVKPSIFFTQALPAILALSLVFLSAKASSNDGRS